MTSTATWLRGTRWRFEKHLDRVRVRSRVRVEIRVSVRVRVRFSSRRRAQQVDEACTRAALGAPHRTAVGQHDLLPDARCARRTRAWLGLGLG